MADFSLGVLPIEDDDEGLSEALLSAEVGIAEVLLTPRSVYIGRTVVQEHFAEKFGVQVLSIRRGDQSLLQSVAKNGFW